MIEATEFFKEIKENLHQCDGELKQKEIKIVLFQCSECGYKNWIIAEK